MCAGRSCATCNVDGLASPCTHDVVARHLGAHPIIETRAPSSEHLEARAPTKPLRKPSLEPLHVNRLEGIEGDQPLLDPLLADRLEVDPSDPESVAHFLETWAQIVRTRRRFTIILQ